MPLALDGEDMTGEQLAKRVTDMGFVRFQIGEITYSVADPLDISVDQDDTVYVVVDRLIRKIDENFDTRLVDSLRIALEKGGGRVSISHGEIYHHFSLHASCPICNYQIDNLSISNFSFNSHRGACTSCHGLGSSTTFLEADIVKSELTIAE